MCRILAIKSSVPFDPMPHLEKLANIAEHSKEYQGHGWGLTYLDEDNIWMTYHNINPIWEDDNLTMGDFPKVTTLLVHARSAFEDEGIVVENNMPFIHHDLAFIFNGELRGVKIKADGRIGAEKIFNFIQKFRKYGLSTAMDRAVSIIDKRTEYIRALNFVIADKERFYISNFYNEDPEYFNLHLGITDTMTIVSSRPYEIDGEWMMMKNYQIEVIE